MKLIKDMTALKIIEKDKTKGGLIIPNGADRIRTEAEVIAAGPKSVARVGDMVIFYPEGADAFDPESKTYFVRDYKISAILR